MFSLDNLSQSAQYDNANVLQIKLFQVRNFILTCQNNSTAFFYVLCVRNIYITHWSLACRNAHTRVWI